MTRPQRRAVTRIVLAVDLLCLAALAVAAILGNRALPAMFAGYALLTTSALAGLFYLRSTNRRP